MISSTSLRCRECIEEPENSRWQGSMFQLHFLALMGVHRLTTRVSAFTVTLVLVIHKAISFDHQHNRYHACGTHDSWFHFFTIDKILDWTNQPWNLFGLDVVRSPSVPSSLWRKQLLEMDMRLMRTEAALVLFGTIGYTIGSQPRESKNQEKSKQE